MLLASVAPQGATPGSLQGGEDKMESPSNPSVYGKILVPYDGSDGAEQALRRALFLVSALGGDITVFIVDEHTPRYAKGVGEVSEDPDLRPTYSADIQATAKDV